MEIMPPETARSVHFVSPALQETVRHSAPFIAQFLGQLDEMLRTAERRRDRRLNAVASYDDANMLADLTRPAVRRHDRRY